MTAHITLVQYDVQASCWTAAESDISKFCSAEESAKNAEAVEAPLTRLRVAFLPKDLQLAQTTLLCSAFGIPDHFFEPLAREATGFFGASELSDGDADEGYRTWFRFLIKRPWMKPAHTAGCSHAFPAAKSIYRWDDLAFFTQWYSSTSTTVLCFGLPDELCEEVRQSLLKSKQLEIASTPYDAHTFILPFIVRAFDSSVWLWRDWVRESELERQENANSREAFLYMHELARHIIHSTEVLTSAINVIRSIIEEQHDRPPMSQPSTLVNVHACRMLHHQRSLLECLLQRSKALERRLQNEISLASNLNAQNDSKIATQIAELSRTDGRVMKTISILGLVFLPGTFVSAIFSMSFFNFQPATADTAAAWRVSEMFWVYWVVTIPITVATIATWHYWQRKQQKAPR